MALGCFLCAYRPKSVNLQQILVRIVLIQKTVRYLFHLFENSHTKVALLL